ncbi:MAG: twin-arginine translocation signal domain-containing protein [Candidatus Schekmanbacteria bacterium]|nr:MAG: twin-arginine translocation signal domain-containing protein [Candidatus Schekmanbacteria bacterium]
MKKEKGGLDRRDFIKTSGAVLGGAVLAAASPNIKSAESAGPPKGRPMAMPPKPLPKMPADAKPAVMYGQIHETDMLGNALNALIQTYASSTPYQHKFNDALVKAHLSYIEFLIKNKMIKKYIKFDREFLAPLMKRVVKRVKKKGGTKDDILAYMFEGTECSFQLFEKIYKRPNERLVVCPFREGIKHNAFLGTTLKIEQVCKNFCTPRWEGQAEEGGIKVKVTPGEICSIKVV